MCADLLWLLWSVTNILYLNKPCDEAMGAAQGSQGQTDLGEPSKLKNSKSCDILQIGSYPLPPPPKDDKLNNDKLVTMRTHTLL